MFLETAYTTELTKKTKLHIDLHSLIEWCRKSCKIAFFRVFRIFRGSDLLFLG
jgi:hypothetical protein